MPLQLEQFIKQLEDSGLVAGDVLKDFIPPKASPKDAEELAGELVRRKKLTEFQAEEVYKGKGKSLVLGNYVLMEKIGAGGMGQVFKARHNRMDRLVAVKLLPPATSSNTDAIARFEREVKAAAKITHPNIVAALDADCANGIHFLVMELVEGGDLSALVRKNGPFSIEKTVNYILQAAKGLEAAHKKGIIHRDIKPANLLLDREGTVKVLDMGLARLSLDGDEASPADLTSTGTVMGTVDYMPPEQALDAKHADARADIYALGCSMYYLLTGMPTYQGDTLMKKLLAHREHPIPSLTATKRGVPELLDSIFTKLVAKRVEDRYQTMTEVVDALENFRDSPTEKLSVEQFDVTVVDVAARNGTIDLDPPSTNREPVSSRGKYVFYLALGAGILGFITLAGVVVSLITKEGKLTVEVDPPDSMVQVLNDEGKVEITQRGVNGKIEISVDPGKHRLKVEKDGFQIYGKEFEMTFRGTKTIKAKLESLETKPTMVETKPDAAGVNTPLYFQTPGFGQWAKEVAALPGEKQVEAVIKKLQELNPEFDGKVTFKIVDDVVIGLQFFSNGISDISPVRALASLKTLQCYGDGKISDFSDLSPLRGLPLTKLICYITKVADLSPLKGMPLTELNISHTQVSDLSQLADVKLTKLFCDSTKVSDLSPLKAMPLRTLFFADAPVTDLSSLDGMSLTHISFSPSNITNGIDIFRQMTSVVTIGVSWKNEYRLAPTDFWTKYDAGEFSKALPQ